MDLANLRDDYIKANLEMDDLKINPFLQFEDWFKEVLSAKIHEPNAMSLATATAAGQPSLRTVLLKYFDHKGFVFFTNYESRKAKEMAENPNVSILFFWKELERQIIICGKVEKVTKMETLKYFVSRPRESQIGAWVSQQSKVVSTRSVLSQKFAEISQKFLKKEIPVPDFWGGFRVIPHSFEFWQGGKNRLHDRFFYSLQKKGEWKIERLSP